MAVRHAQPHDDADRLCTSGTITKGLSLLQEPSTHDEHPIEPSPAET